MNTVDLLLRMTTSVSICSTLAIEQFYRFRDSLANNKKRYLSK